jgi:hypothetical protein
LIQTRKTNATETLNWLAPDHTFTAGFGVSFAALGELLLKIFNNAKTFRVSGDRSSLFTGIAIADHLIGEQPNTKLTGGISYGGQNKRERD